MQNSLFILCIVHCALCTSACSIPNLEGAECSQAREAVKHFYSFHFGNDMTVTTDNLKARQRFLTPEFFGTLSSQSGTNVDPFTKADTPPKTFKIAKCTQVGSDKADVAVQIYWRYETGKVDQRELHVETIKSGDAWLINKVSN